MTEISWLKFIYGQDLERLDIFGDSIFHFLGVIVLLVSYSHALWEKNPVLLV